MNARALRKSTACITAEPLRILLLDDSPQFAQAVL